MWRLRYQKPAFSLLDVLRDCLNLILERIMDCSDMTRDHDYLIMITMRANEHKKYRMRIVYEIPSQRDNEFDRIFVDDQSS